MALAKRALGSAAVLNECEGKLAAHRSVAAKDTLKISLTALTLRICAKLDKGSGVKYRLKLCLGLTVHFFVNLYHNVPPFHLLRVFFVSGFSIYHITPILM